jgi:hypothetical protein
MNALAVEFCNLLITAGYVERQRVERDVLRSVADANTAVAYQHPELGWAHVNQFNRGKSERVECILHPQLLGERTVHLSTHTFHPRLAEIQRRAQAGPPGKVWSERQPKRKRDSW